MNQCNLIDRMNESFDLILIDHFEYYKGKRRFLMTDIDPNFFLIENQFKNSMNSCLYNANLIQFINECKFIYHLKCVYLKQFEYHLIVESKNFSFPQSTAAL